MTNQQVSCLEQRKKQGVDCIKWINNKKEMKKSSMKKKRQQRRLYLEKIKSSCKKRSYANRSEYLDKLLNGKEFGLILNP